MLPEELQNIFNEFDEDYFSLYVTRASDSTDKFIIDFILTVQDINERGGMSQKWTIEATGHIRNSLSFDFAPFMEIKSDHPLLWEYTDIQCQLYFTGKCEDLPRLFYDLYVTHKKLFGRYECFNIDIWEEKSHFKRFMYTNGLLTQGPKKLMDMYGHCLEQNGLGFTIIGKRPGEYWDGKESASQDAGLKILLLGESYIIAKDFTFLKQEDIY